MKKKKQKRPTRLQRVVAFLGLKRIKIPLIIVAVIVLLTETAPAWNPILFPPVKNPDIGVSFSEKRSQEMGLDWKANYLALLDDMHIKHFRLMSYWDIHEPVRGQIDFSTLDWQIEEAAKRGADVTLGIGLRQPRWPECHQPEWASKLTGGDWEQALFSYVAATAKHYEHSANVISWQLENEGMNNWFGTCDKPDRPRLIKEYKLLDSLTDKPIWMSLSDQHGLPFGQPWPDKFGYSVYRTVWSDKTWPYIGYLTYPTPIWYHRLRAVLIKWMTGRDIFIHELQLEPWGKVDTLQLSTAEQDKSMDTKQIQKNFYFAREIGAKQIYTWGGEWWYWRKVHGDPSIWNTVKQTFEESQQP